MIYLRTVTDGRGDVSDYLWYDSVVCYTADIIDHPERAELEGGAYPGGAENDTPDYCAHCGDPVGNPLTGEGERFVVDLIREGNQELRDTYQYLDPMVRGYVPEEVISG